MSLINLNFESQYLRNNTEISIILPDKPRDVDAKDYYESQKKYKVLWLLHGGYGNHSDWVRKSMIEIYAREKNLIVVMPSALNSFYSDWPGFMMGFDMYGFLIGELMPLVYNWLPASSAREDNFIAGLSMGGFGAVKYAVNHPEKFAAAAVFSAAPINPKRVANSPASSFFQNLIDNAGGSEAFESSPDNTRKLILDKAKSGSLPKLYFACGKDDFLYDDIYLPFKEYAQTNDIPITFEEMEGYAHEWRFWDLVIQRALVFFGLGDADLGKLF